MAFHVLHCTYYNSCFFFMFCRTNSFRCTRRNVRKHELMIRVRTKSFDHAFILKSNRVKYCRERDESGYTHRNYQIIDYWHYYGISILYVRLNPELTGEQYETDDFSTLKYVRMQIESVCADPMGRYSVIFWNITMFIKNIEHQKNPQCVIIIDILIIGRK